MPSKIPVDKGWDYAQLGPSQTEWTACESFPTSVHVELLKAGKIPDPYIAMHEWDVQWIGEAEWAFKTVLDLTAEQLREPHADLVFEGLDTFATVIVNGQSVLETENMFLTYRVDVKKHLKAGINEIYLKFASAFRKGRALELQHGKMKLWNGDSSRLHIRKAQYNYGWDWGPILMTVGPWRPITLETYTARISDLRVSPIVDRDLTTTITTTFEVEGAPASGATAQFVLKSPSGKVVKTEEAKVQGGKGKLSWKFAKGDLELWYPVGYGKQPIYTVEVQLADAQGVALNATTQKIGIRRAEVIQRPLEDDEGMTFFFQINNIPVFCGGSNWIPADNFLTDITAQRYRDWLQLMVAGNQNMVRVWGGGIYEPDVFYDICDELGLLVWQDFMFGCGQYPAYESLVANVKLEVECNVKRLRHHPALVIFAGNNEDYQLAEAYKLDLDYADNSGSKDFTKTDFPARHFYEKLMPEVVARLSDTHYHRSSPYSGFGKDTRDQKHGDLHQWNVWHGSQEPWHNWDILAGRFVSEFGMQGYPDIRTVDYWLGGDAAERFPQSRSSNNHNKADGFERRLELYLMENFKHAFDMESYVYYTQMMQAETLAAAYRLWRRNWKGPGKEHTAGALVWQINDCWPCTSWAIVDYFLRPKPAFFSVARELRPYTVGMTRKDHTTYKDPLSADEFVINTELQIWGCNSTLLPKKVKLIVEAFDLNSDFTHSFTQDVVLAPNASTEVYKGEVPGQPTRTKLSEAPKTIIISARILETDGTVLARYANWPEPFKYIHYPAPSEVGLNIKTAADGETLEISVKKPIKGLILDVDGEEVKWSDQALDLVPGDVQVVKAVGLGGRKVKARFLGDGTA